MKRDLILGTAWNYDIEKLAPFVLSWKKYCSDSSDLVLVVNPEIKKSTATFLKSSGVVIKSFLAAHFIPDTLNITRYFKYFDILSEEKDKYSGVLLTDVRDVVFQKNPFNNITRKGLHFFYEDSKVLIGTDDFGSSQMRYAYGEKILEELHDKRVICSGTTIGDQISITRYVHAMSIERTLPQMMKVIPSGTYLYDNPPVDQSIHQYLFYKSIIRAQVHENGDIVSTLAQSSPKNIFIDDYGFIQLDNKISHIVHQWDRHKNLREHIENTYKLD